MSEDNLQYQFFLVLMCSVYQGHWLVAWRDSICLPSHYRHTGNTYAYCCRFTWVPESWTPGLVLPQQVLLHCLISLTKHGEVPFLIMSLICLWIINFLSHSSYIWSYETGVWRQRSWTRPVPVTIACKTQKEIDWEPWATNHAWFGINHVFSGYRYHNTTLNMPERWFIYSILNQMYRSGKLLR